MKTFKTKGSSLIYKEPELVSVRSGTSKYWKIYNVLSSRRTREVASKQR